MSRIILKDNIIIIGTGQHARVVLYNAKCQDKYNIIGFISKNEAEINNLIDGIPIIGTEKQVKELITIHNIKGYILGIGDMNTRRKLIDYYDSNIKLEAITIIHPDAIIGEDALIGGGTLIECRCQVTPNPIIGKHCVINTMTGVNHDNILGENVYLASGVTLSGSVEIEKDTLIDDGVIVTLGKNIGKRCIIGAGAVVTKDIKDDSIAFGVPAKIVKQNIY